MADWTTTLGPGEEAALNWKATQQGVTAQQIFNALVNRGLNQLQSERKDFRKGRMQDKFEVLTPQDQQAILAILGDIDT
jgi:hypothetical protein